MPALASEPGLHPPDRDQRAWWHAVALLDRREQRRVGALQAAPARDYAGSTALGEKLVEREPKASLAAIGGDGRAGIIGLHQGGHGWGADTLCPRLLGEFPLPRVE